MNDYKTRKDRMQKHGRTFLQVEASIQLLKAVMRRCKEISKSQGIRFTLTRAVDEALRDWLNK